MSKTIEHQKSVTVMVVERDKSPHIKRVPAPVRKLEYSDNTAKTSRIRHIPNIALAKAIFG